jgi:two-component system cell cycle response regulator
VPGTEQLASIAGLYATLVPLASEAGVVGAAALFTEQMPAPAALRGVEFLARSAAMSIQTLERFSQTEQLAYIDDLTHLFNGRYLQQLLERECGEKSEGPFSLLFIDLDHFKQVNDGFGHLIGSRLLVEVARVLRGCVRERDVATRYGGDEFCVVLRRADKATAVHIAERIRSAIANHNFLAREGKNVRITASIGVACCPEHASDAPRLLDLADQAMYRGKRSTRNTIYLATSQAA